MNDIYENGTDEIDEMIESAEKNEITETDDTVEETLEAESEEDDGEEEEDELSNPETIKALKEELNSLRRELEDTRLAYGRLSKECEEFSELYPSVPITSIPDSIWKSFKSGVPLAAAYALYEKKEAVAREKASSINEKNKRLSSGSLKSDKNEEYFTPAEVRAMSAAEVKANYAKIINSMSRWH